MTVKTPEKIWYIHEEDVKEYITKEDAVCPCGRRFGWNMEKIPNRTWYGPQTRSIQNRYCVPIVFRKKISARRKMRKKTGMDFGEDREEDMVRPMKLG